MGFSIIRPANKAANRLYGDAPVAGISIIKHNGNDYPWGNGYQIYAAADGVVRKVSWKPDRLRNNRFGGYGNHFYIDHGNGWETLYAHIPNDRMIVFNGLWVAQRDLIAFMGNTGNASGIHLHFEVRYNGRIVNPNPYFTNSSAAGAGGTIPVKAGFLMALNDTQQAEFYNWTRDTHASIAPLVDAIAEVKRDTAAIRDALFTLEPTSLGTSGGVLAMVNNAEIKIQRIEDALFLETPTSRGTPKGVLGTLALMWEKLK